MPNLLRKTLILLTVLYWLPGAMFAAPISADRAKSIAYKFMNRRGVTIAQNALTRSTPTQTSSRNYYYVFNAYGDKGFVIVSGDDRTPQVLGYSDKGNIDVNSLPENIKSFLQTYGDEIEYLDKTGTTSVQTRATSRTPVAPFLQSEWNQDSPYNDACPYLQGGTTRGYTGCIATAMSQVMYYFKYPESTTAAIPSYKYSWTEDGTDSVTVAGLPAGLQFDWSSMRDSYYPQPGSITQRAAVARLMNAAGRSVEMQYRDGGSAAYDMDIVPALRRYFDYTASIIYRQNYTLSEFENILYDEVSASRPVIMSGQSTGGGHSFVIDGCDSTGLFHVNWGWGGVANGYFLVSLMNPNTTTGIGASTSHDGYSMYQSAVVGIAKGASTTVASVPLSLTVSNMEVVGDSITGGIFNLTGETHRFDVAAALVDSTGSVTRVLETVIQNQSIDPNYGYSIQVPVNGYRLTAGTYNFAFVSRLTGTEDWHASSSGIVRINVSSSGEVTAAVASSIDNITVTGWDFTGDLMPDTNQSVTITVHNSGAEYYGNVYLYLSYGDDRTSRKLNAETGLTAAGYGNTDIVMEFTPENGSGTYNLELCSDADGNNVIGSTKVSIGDSSTGIERVKSSVAASENAARNMKSYNLSGQRVGKSYKGIVIRNGKKYLSK